MSEYSYRPDDLTNTFVTSEQGNIADRASTVVADDFLVEQLRMGDEAAFTLILDQYSPSMVRLAMIYVMNRAIAEEVVQDTWLGVLRGLDRFEYRYSLKTMPCT